MKFPHRTFLHFAAGAAVLPAVSDRKRENLSDEEAPNQGCYLIPLADRCYRQENVIITQGEVS